MQFNTEKGYDETAEKVFFIGIRFSTPGLDLKEIPKRDFDLMDDIRKTSEKYFSQRPK